MKKNSVKYLMLLLLIFAVSSFSKDITKLFAEKEHLQLNGSDFSLQSDCTAKNYPRVKLGDIDNDGDLDLILYEVFENPYTGRFSYVENIGTREKYSFTTIEKYGTEIQSEVEGWCAKAMGLQVVDLNNDGNLDLTFTTQSGITKYFTGDGASNFTRGSNFITSSRVAMTYYDLDDDGDLDMIGSGNRVSDPESEWGFETMSVLQTISNSGTVSAPIFSSTPIRLKDADGGNYECAKQS